MPLAPARRRAFYSLPQAVGGKGDQLFFRISPPIARRRTTAMKRRVRVSLPWVNPASRHPTGGSLIRDSLIMGSLAAKVAGVKRFSENFCSFRRIHAPHLFSAPGTVPSGIHGSPGANGYDQPGSGCWGDVVAVRDWVFSLTQRKFLDIREVTDYLNILPALSTAGASGQGLCDRDARGVGAAAHRRPRQGATTPSGIHSWPEE